MSGVAVYVIVIFVECLCRVESPFIRCDALPNMAGVRAVVLDGVDGVARVAEVTIRSAWFVHVFAFVAGPFRGLVRGQQVSGGRCAVVGWRAGGGRQAAGRRQARQAGGRRAAVMF